MENLKDKYKAIWVSHSSISDFLKCPRFYYLRNVYKDPQTGNKITVMSPPLALGQIVHEVIEGLSFMKVDERLKTPLSDIFELAWSKVSGEKGGFKNESEEKEFKNRGKEMLLSVEKNPGPILNKAVKIRADGGLPWYWFSENENIILCGKIDWLEYLEASGGVHIVDFKTGKNEEGDDSLQLPIYLLLAKNTQKRKVEKLSYWYLDQNKIIERKLPDEDDSKEKVMKIAQRIKLARQINHFKCPKGGCFYCRQLERVLKGEGKLVGESEYRQNIYVLRDS